MSKDCIPYGEGAGFAGGIVSAGTGWDEMCPGSDTASRTAHPKSGCRVVTLKLLTICQGKGRLILFHFSGKQLGNTMSFSDKPSYGGKSRSDEGNLHTEKIQVERKPSSSR